MSYFSNSSDEKVVTYFSRENTADARAHLPLYDTQNIRRFRDVIA